MADDKDLLKNDLIMITQLNSKIHYDKKDEVKKVHDMILQKGILKTSIGQKYIKRLEQISNEENTQSKCIICENGLVYNSAICTTCLKKIQQLQTQKENVTQSPNIDTYQPEIHENLQDQTSNENVPQSPNIDTYQPETHQNSQAQTSNENVPQSPNIDTYQPETHQNSQAQTSNENISQSLNIDANQTKTTNDSLHNVAKLLSNILTDKNKTKKLVIIGSIFIILCIIVASIGLGNIFAFLTFIAICILIHKIVKKQNKRNTIIALVILCVLTGIFYKDTSSDDLISLMGVDAEKVYDIYGEEDFTQSATGDVSNSGTNGDPTIILAGNPTKVNYISLESGSNSSLNVCGIHLGDSEEDVINAMEDINADYDSLNGKTLFYNYEYNSNKLLIMYRINDGIVEMISVAIPND